MEAGSFRYSAFPSSAFIPVYSQGPGDLIFEDTTLNVAKFQRLQIEMPPKNGKIMQHTVMVQPVIFPPSKVLYTQVIKLSSYQVVTDGSTKLRRLSQEIYINRCSHMLQYFNLSNFFRPPRLRLGAKTRQKTLNCVFSSST
jgi:hypothetical protein